MVNMIYNYKEIWKISAPILVGLAIQQFITLIDTAFLGRVGEIELGASAIAGVFYLMLFMFGHGFSIGAQIIIARRNGENNISRIGEVFYQGFSFLLICSFVLIFSTLSFSEFILRKIISSNEILTTVLDYLEPRTWGLLFAFSITIFRAFYVGIVTTKTLTYMAIVMLIVNIILDYLLIFGNFGFPELGIRGAAIASVFAEASACIFLILYTFVNIPIKKYGFNKIVLWNMPLLKEILSVSFWTVIQSFVSVATWFMFFVAIEHIGETNLAISNILRSISAILFMIVAAFGAAANSITSNLIGAGHEDEVIPTVNKNISMTFIITFFLAVMMAIFPEQTMQIYTDDTHLIKNAEMAFYIMLTTYITAIPSFILFNAVSGTGHTKIALLMEIIASFVYVLYLLYIISYLKSDIALCWTCDHSYNIILGILSFVYMRRNKWCCKIV